MSEERIGEPAAPGRESAEGRGEQVDAPGAGEKDSERKNEENEPKTPRERDEGDYDV